jgi:hypothetical protein
VIELNELRFEAFMVAKTTFLGDWQCNTELGTKQQSVVGQDTESQERRRVHRGDTTSTPDDRGRKVSVKWDTSSVFAQLISQVDIPVV